MNNEPIEAEHRRYKEFLKEHNLKVGSVIKIKAQGYTGETTKEVTITWINSYYGWFGSGELNLKPEDVVFDEPGVKHEEETDDTMA